MAARFPVVCGDTRWPSSVRTYQRNAAVDRVRHPMLGGATASVNPCAFWHGERVEGPVRITGRGPANVLISQNERDPGTPLAGAREMRGALGGRAVLVTADQGGHGTYLFGANECANGAVTAFLARGERPTGDLACPAQPNRPGDGTGPLTGERAAPLVRPALPHRCPVTRAGALRAAPRAPAPPRSPRRARSPGRTASRWP
ncbi:alpha/beta hydrolase [Actinosynnema pretiosum]|uniref:Peptidase S33 tripeptidyl aminopeptidase-like C-terminal domain-containing protein n=1 Tax=Actinosynnema pretiosum TaxID=42197 RepID=A0A290Z6M3_9PSEU|nr:alpha/beta hydrolase [Actinosynnema pretiosum]ATE54701.1 hypothetical protein CNX65_16615 [Actinosynnema pretiosum]